MASSIGTRLPSHDNLGFEPGTQLTFCTLSLETPVAEDTTIVGGLAVKAGCRKAEVQAQAGNAREVV